MSETLKSGNLSITSSVCVYVCVSIPACHPPEHSPAWKHVRLLWQRVIVSYHLTRPGSTVTAYFNGVLNITSDEV